MIPLGWYVKFMLKIDLEFLLRKTMVRLNLKIDLGSLHISPGPHEMTLKPKSNQKGHKLE